MNRTEIRQMPAGREMDRLACALIEPQPDPVLLAGLRKGKDWHYSVAYADSPAGAWEAEIGEDADVDGRLFCCWSPALEPSSDIAAAWQVVEKLRADGWLVRVQEMPDDIPFLARENPDVIVTIRCACMVDWIVGRKGDTESIRKWMDSHHVVLAETSSLAICRAALMTLTNTEDESKI